MSAGGRPVSSDNRLHTAVIIITLHLAWEFRPTPVYEYVTSPEQMEERKREQERVEMFAQAYLQLPEDLRLATGLEVLQSLGPEAVLLVQGAIATRGTDESMTTQEPEHESGPVVSGLALLTKAAWEMQFLARASPWKTSHIGVLQ